MLTEREKFQLYICILHTCRCGALIEMYSTAVTASLSYFRSQNPLLRRNVVILLAEILNYTQKTDTEMVAEEIISDIVTGMVGLLKDQDKIVRTVAAEQLGRVLLIAHN